MEKWKLIYLILVQNYLFDSGNNTIETNISEDTSRSSIGSTEESEKLNKNP
jgi:hypothetical protein